MKEVFGVNINWLMTGVHATLLAARTTKQYNNLKSRFDTLKEAIRARQ